MPKLETFKKQAKLLVRWHREGNHSIGGRIRQLPRYRTVTAPHLADPDGNSIAFVG